MKVKTFKKYRDPILLLGYCVTFLTGAVLAKWPEYEKAFAAPINPQPLHSITTITTDLPDENIDAWIRGYAEKFANKKKPVSYLKYQLQCLANKESGHHATNVCGDGGKSCGLYQYRQSTWNGFRKIMMKQGLVTEIGSLWNDKQAVETTAWALANGRDMNWGPIVNRGECL